MSGNNDDFVFEVLNRDALDDILKIEKEVHISPWSAQKFLSCFSDNLYLLTGLYNNECLIAYAVLLVNPPEAELHNIAVSKHFQHRGLGKAFLNYITHRCVEMKLETVFLEVRENNTAAINLYQKSGFSQVGLRKNYYRSETQAESALIFELGIN